MIVTAVMDGDVLPVVGHGKETVRPIWLEEGPSARRARSI